MSSRKPLNLLEFGRHARQGRYPTAKTLRAAEKAGQSYEPTEVRLGKNKGDVSGENGDKGYTAYTP